jgi:hypothetical protein
MKVFQTTDHHLKNEEPFFCAGVALDNWILDRLKKETEKFVYLDGGDRFHISKETGRVNGEVVHFFMKVAAIPNCCSVLVMQGNHDVKSDTGSALDVIQNLDTKIKVIDEPTIAHSEMEGFYLLPHMRPYSMGGYIGVKSYGDENWHREFWKSRGKDWESLKPNIKMVSIHAGDESSGELFKDVDISFLNCARSNGHIHKPVSKNHLVSASVTRRDERDKKCAMRIIDTETYSFVEESIPLFLNYALIPYGSTIEDYFKSEVHILPRESLILDIYGHDDEDAVAREYSRRYENFHMNKDMVNYPFGFPKVYIGRVMPVERKGEEAKVDIRDDCELGTINIRGLFGEFCKEKKIADDIRDDMMARL